METRTPTRRIEAIDALRGIVMILMAVDHVRVYSGVPAGGPTWGVFLTRWVTHFCAPVFVFLAGTAAYLHGRKLGGPGPLARYLATRGLLLVVLELTVLRLAWTFNLDVTHALAGVIWVIGWCFVLLALFVRLPQAVIGAIGVAIVAGHDVLDSFPAVGEAARASRYSGLFQVLYFGGPVAIGPGSLFVLYSIVPWIGVTLAGYAFGSVTRLAPERRRRICARLGAALVVAFLALRALDRYGDPRPWRIPTVPTASSATSASSAPAKVPPPAALRFLNTSKYPASLLFLLMTLGPAIAALPVLERAEGGRTTRVLSTFGRVPLFYYVLHIPLIHVLACLVSLARSGHVDPWLFLNHPATVPPAPPGYRWSLGLLCAVTAVAVAILAPLCRARSSRRAA